MFKDKIAVITGAGSSIGRAFALQLAEQGAMLALSDINSQSLDETMQMLPEADVSTLRARAYQLDVSSRQAVFDHAEQVKQDVGSVHFVFDNAGAA